MAMLWSARIFERQTKLLLCQNGKGKAKINEKYQHIYNPVFRCVENGLVVRKLYEFTFDERLRAQVVLKLRTLQNLAGNSTTGHHVMDVRDLKQVLFAYLRSFSRHVLMYRRSILLHKH